jgi:putative ATPase
MPECNLALAQAVDYLSRAKKSNALYRAYQKVLNDINELGPLGVPLHIRNAPTKLLKDLGYSKGYIYNPEAKDPVKQEYLPEELKNKDYFEKNV